MEKMKIKRRGRLNSHPHNFNPQTHMQYRTYCFYKYIKCLKLNKKYFNFFKRIYINPSIRK